MTKTIIGVMGAGSATPKDLDLAYQLGKSIAEHNWVLLTGGREAGVMDAASQGAKAGGGLIIGILPGDNKSGVSKAVDIAIVSDLGNARNNLNVLSSDVVVACGIGLGTVSEIALALKNNKPVILLNQSDLTNQFFSSLAQDKIYLAKDIKRAIALTKEILQNLK